MVRRAIDERTTSKRAPFQYYAVLTKADKLDEEDIARCNRKVQDVASEALGLPIKTLITSAATRQGAEEMWRHIYPLLKD